MSRCQELFDSHDALRREIARELHSTAAQYLAALQINLSLIPAEGLPSRATKALSDSASLAKECAATIRRISARLYPPLLDEAGLVPALQAFAAEFGAAAEGETGRLPSSISLAAFRIVEDLIATAQEREKVAIQLQRGPKTLTIQVTGVGDLPHPVTERIHQLGGRFSRVGTATRIVLPVRAARA
jgi:signal transduction histidine kinase